MIDKRHQDLIHRHLDGELTTDEQDELNRCLDASASARAFYDRMQLLKTAGETRQDEPPPTGLRQDVMRDVRQVAAQTATKGSIWDDIRNAFRPIFAPRVVYGIAAGLILGFAMGALTLWGGGQAPSSVLDYSGTLGIPGSTERQRIDEGGFDEAGVSAAWVTDRVGDQVLLSVEISSEADAQVIVTYDPSSIIAQGLSQGGPDLAQVQMAQGMIQAVHTGEGSLMILFHTETSSPQSIELQFVTDGAGHRETVAIAN